MPAAMKIFFALTLTLFAAQSICAAILTATPPPSVVPPGETHLANPAFLATPGPFWAGIVLDWGQTAEVSIQAAVSDETIFLPNHTVIMTAINRTDLAWSGMEIDVTGPATFSLTAPTGSSLDAPTTIVTPTRLTFAGIDWPAPISGSPTSTSINFGLDVTSPNGDEWVVLTFRPVPEPSTAALVLCSGLLTCRRRR